MGVRSDGSTCKQRDRQSHTHRVDISAAILCRQRREENVQGRCCVFLQPHHGTVLPVYPSGLSPARELCAKNKKCGTCLKHAENTRSAHLWLMLIGCIALQEMETHQAALSPLYHKQCP